jgi:GcrA cell cycle regulator
MAGRNRIVGSVGTEQLLKRLYLADASFAQMSEQSGYPENEVRHILSLMGLGRKKMANKWTPELVSQLKVLWCAHKLTAAEIGHKLGGLTRMAVIGKVNRLGLEPRMKGQTAKRDGFVRKKRTYKRQIFGGTHTLPRPTPVPIIDADIPADQLRDFMELEAPHCRFPVRGREKLFCGAVRANDKTSYCEFHHDLCTQPAVRQASLERLVTRLAA